MAKPFAAYPYANTGQTFTTRISTIYPACQMRPNMINGPVLFEKVQIAPSSYWVFVNWGEAQLGGYWSVDYRTFANTVWQPWSSAGCSFLNVKTFTPDSYILRVRPMNSLPNTYNAASQFTMVI